MTELNNIVSYCNERVEMDAIVDFGGAMNGLQFEGKSEIKKIGAAVDAGLEPFRKAIDAGIDFLIVHHGMFWEGPKPYVGARLERLRMLIDAGMSVYGCHLPLDAHEDLGNNAQILKHLGLELEGRFMEYEGTPIGITAKGLSRKELSNRLTTLFPKTYTGMEFGSENPARIAISSGSGNAPIEEVVKLGIDTLITGEVKQHHYNFAQENRLNLYSCGHYATEVFGVDALGREVAEKFDLEYEFIEMDCLL